MNVVAIIQARMGSSRLPGKVLQDLAGQPMLARVFNRASRANALNLVTIATSTSPQDDEIEAFCHAHEWPVFRGNETDVLDRYYQAAQHFQADIIVRITADCPLIEPDIINSLIEPICNQPLDYVNNRLPPISFPRGMEMDVMTYETLTSVWKNDTNPKWREHVTPYIYNHPKQYRIHTVRNTQNHSHLRWTVDAPEDLIFAQKIYKHFQTDTFVYQDILDLLDTHPDWLEINRTIKKLSPPYIIES